MKKKSCDHRETLYGKGDLRRPVDHKKFGDNYDRIFGKKEKKRG